MCVILVSGVNHIAEEVVRSPSAGVALVKDDYIVAVEVFAQYEAFIFPDLVGTSIVYKRSFEQPRLPDIITVN